VQQSKQQAKAEYDISMAQVEGNLSVTLEKCKMMTGDEATSCAQTAQSVHDQAIEAIKAKLTVAYH
jgi:hypothetical protein